MATMFDTKALLDQLPSNPASFNDVLFPLLKGLASAHPGRESEFLFALMKAAISVFSLKPVSTAFEQAAEDSRSDSDCEVPESGNYIDVSDPDSEAEGLGGLLEAKALRTFGKYKEVSFLGAGAFGAVLKVTRTDKDDNSPPYVLKLQHVGKREEVIKVHG